MCRPLHLFHAGHFRRLRSSLVGRGITRPAIFQGDVAWILQDEIEIAPNFEDDINVLGPRTRYEKEDGTYEVLEGNPGIRRFVWEHCLDLNRVLHRLKTAGATMSAKKLFVARDEVVVVGQRCSYEGRSPDLTKVDKIKTWPPCTTRTEVRGFLGTAGTVRIWVKNFAAISRPLVELTKKTVSFKWGVEEQNAMDKIKKAIINSPAIRPIDYLSGREVLLSVDSSNLAVGYILAQLDEKDRRRPARFGSISWNEREARYSQAKIELYGLFRALKAAKLFIIGVKNLTVEVDAKYIKGMLNNPDAHPNATINRWIAGILLFDFKLVHVPGIKHKGPDGLSRRRVGEDDDDDEENSEEVEGWLDEVLGCGIWVAGGIGGGEEKVLVMGLALAARTSTSTIQDDSATDEQDLAGDMATLLPADLATTQRDIDLQAIQTFLTSLKRPKGITDQQFSQFYRRAQRFFVRGGRLWRKDPSGRHQLVLLSQDDRLRMLCETHDNLGHRGFYPTRRTIADRFWWPSLDSDLQWYLKTCHQCQVRSIEKVVIPPVVARPAPLFRKAYIDSMYLPAAGGYHFLVQARCSLANWPEFRPLRTETGRTLGAFIFEEILCRWGGLEELVTDNGTPFVAALDWLAEKYHIRHIRISPYNSRANGIVERSHRTIRDSLVKACNGDISKWPSLVHHVFWADRVTTRRATGHSPYFLAHGVEPLLPFDILEATFMLPDIDARLDTADLLAIRAQQLIKRDEDLETARERLYQSRIKSIQQYEKQHINSIRDYDFAPGTLVLILNKKIEPDAGRKCKPRYLGPMVVVRRARNSSYRLAELDGAISKLKFAAFRLIPYYPRSSRRFEVTEFVDPKDLAGIDAEEEEAEVLDG